MKNLLLSTAIGDIAGMPYEFRGRTKDYESVNLLLPSNTYTLNQSNKLNPIPFRFPWTNPNIGFVHGFIMCQPQ